MNKDEILGLVLIMSIVSTAFIPLFLAIYTIGGIELCIPLLGVYAYILYCVYYEYKEYY